MLNTIYTLPELCFVGGSSETLEFNLYRNKDNPTPFDLNGGAAHFSLVNMINKGGAPVVEKEMTVDVMEGQGTDSPKNVVRVTLDPSDTVDLFGKFVYQITLVDVEKNIVSYQGVAMIHNNINKGLIKEN